MRAYEATLCSQALMPVLEANILTKSYNTNDMLSLAALYDFYIFWSQRQGTEASHQRSSSVASPSWRPFSSGRGAPFLVARDGEPSAQANCTRQIGGCMHLSRYRIARFAIWAKMCPGIQKSDHLSQL